jgi:hypothetical protein
MTDIFEAWSAAHDENYRKASELDDEVVRLIEPQAVPGPDGRLRYSRQKVASWLDRHNGTCVGGYTLCKAELGPASKPIAHYKVKKVLTPG